MGDSDKTEGIPPYLNIPRAWEKANEVQVKPTNGRKSIVDGIKTLRDVLTAGTISDILAIERQSPDWTEDWSLVSMVYRLVCQDLTGQNRSLNLRDTKSLPKGFSYEVVAQFYRGPTPPV